MEPEREVLVRERRVPRRVSPRVLVALAVLALAVVAAGWVVDSRWRSGEEREVAACRSGLVAAVRAVDERMGAMAEYIRPTLSTLRGQRAHELADLMRRPAREVLPRLVAAREACARVHVRSWHPATASTLRATNAYATAVLTRLRRASVEGAWWFRNRGQVDRLRARAGLSPP